MYISVVYTVNQPLNLKREANEELLPSLSPKKEEVIAFIPPTNNFFMPILFGLGPGGGQITLYRCLRVDQRERGPSAGQDAWASYRSGKEWADCSRGKGNSDPADALVIPADSMYVYAGFIDGLSHTGVPKPKEEAKKKSPSAPAAPLMHGLAFGPNRMSVICFLPSKIGGNHAWAGFTVAHVVPHGKMLPGKGAVILLAEGSTADWVLRDNVSLFSQLEGADGVYPSTIMGVMAKYRELYRGAQQVKLHSSKYQQSPTGMARPSPTWSWSLLSRD